MSDEDLPLDSYKTRTIAASSHLKKNLKEGNFLTHTVVDGTRVLCGEVKISSILDDEYATDENAPPTHDKCLRRDPRFNSPKPAAPVPSPAPAKSEKPSGPAPQEALDYFRSKKIHPAFDYHSVWKEEHHFAFTVAKIAEKSILKDVHASLEKALAVGTTFREWADEVKPMLEKSGWSSENTPEQQPSRLANIYQTNMRMARANGQEDRAQRVKHVLPYFIYELGPSKVHRVEHEELEGTTLPVDDPWWDHYAPPIGFGCKCRRRQITQNEADEDGGPDESPEIDYEESEGADGEKIMTPEGVDPGFDYPKGTDGRRRGLQDALDSDE